MGLTIFNSLPTTSTFIEPALIDPLSSLSHQPFYVLGEQIQRLCSYVYSKWPSLPVASAQKLLPTNENIKSFRTYNFVEMSDEEYAKALNCKKADLSVCSINDQVFDTGKLCEKIINQYVERAKQETKTRYQAYFYEQAKSAIEELGDLEEKKLIPGLVEDEAKACFQSYQSATNLLEKATWLLTAANLLDQTEQYQLAGEYWNELGDLIIKTPGSFNFPTNSSFYSPYPEFYVPMCYKNAANAFNLAKRLRGEWGPTANQPSLIDKAISVMESIKMNYKDYYFLSDYYDSLSNLYKININLLRINDGDYENLKSIIYQLSLESAKAYNNIIKNSNQLTYHHYKKAKMLSEAASYAPTLSEATKLLREAKDFSDQEVDILI